MTVPKLRAWHKPMQRMSEVLAISYERQKVKIRHLRGTTHMTVTFDDVVIMQSTGLFDKNGNEIFEGDIVHAYSEGARLIGVIEYFDNAYCIKDKNGIYNALWINAEHYEVVGSIWDDGELVEEQND
jgi:uncharacterized phage protein (TIGR01671 family)